MYDWLVRICVCNVLTQTFVYIKLLPIPIVLLNILLLFGNDHFLILQIPDYFKLVKHVFEGDRLLTDVVFGNECKMVTVLVSPLSNTKDHPIAVLIRSIERWLILPIVKLVLLLTRK